MMRFVHQCIAAAVIFTLAAQIPAFAQQPQQSPQSQQPQQSQQPEGNVRSTHGAWSIVCDKPGGAMNEQCIMMQSVVAEDRPEMGLFVAVLRTADGKAELMRVMAPLGVLLPNGLGLFIDGEDKGRAYFMRCLHDGCWSEVILDDTLKTTLRSGTSATFVVFQTPEEGIGIPVDLDGFEEAFNALPQN